MALELEILEGPQPQSVRTWRLETGRMTIGRGEDCDWRIDDPEHFVSRQHCVISGEDGRWTVLDASSGGLFVDGADAPLGPGRSAELADGTRLRLGSFVIGVRLGTGAAVSLAPVETPPSWTPAPGSADSDAPRFDDPFAVAGEGGASAPLARSAARAEEAPPSAPERPLIDDPFGDSGGPAPMAPPPINRSPSPAPAPPARPAAQSPRPASGGSAGGFSDDDFFARRDAATPASAPPPYRAPAREPTGFADDPEPQSADSTGPRPFEDDPFMIDPSRPGGPSARRSTSAGGGDPLFENTREGGAQSEDPSPQQSSSQSSSSERQRGLLSDPFADDDDAGAAPVAEATAGEPWDAPAQRAEAAPVRETAPTPEADWPASRPQAEIPSTPPEGTPTEPVEAAPTEQRAASIQPDARQAQGTVADPWAEDEPAPTASPPAYPPISSPEPLSLSAAPPPAASLPIAPPAPAPSSPPAAASDGEAAAVLAFLRGAGIDPSELRGPAPSAEALGRRYRLLLDGLVRLLEARRAAKGSAYIPQTMFGASDVNPLKFSATEEEALLAAIVPRGRGYLAPDAAIEEAFADLYDHQIGVWHGIEAALARMIDRFSPEMLEEEAEALSLLGSVLAGGRRARLWEVYKARFKEISRQAETSFLGEVGRDFAEAYTGRDRAGTDKDRDGETR
ncbi:MAG: type VI secretion system-associated FHA domain protein TagH [Pseudomonadota bacterium]